MIYYSHVNEDNRVERSLLEASGCSTVVAIAGSGERVIALMDYNACDDFYVIDINPDALHLLALKLAVLEQHTVKTYLGFCGYAAFEGSQRVALFNNIKGRLPPESRNFWEARQHVISKGIAYSGHFEKFLRRLQPFIGFYLGSRFSAMLSEQKTGQQSFPARRWRLLMKLFKQRWVYKILGNRDIAFISDDATIAHIPAALNRVISSGEANACFMAHLIFKGHTCEMQEKDLPPSLQQHVLKRVKERLMSPGIRIHYLHGDLLYCAEKINASNVFYSASDILSFTDHVHLQQLLAKTLQPGNHVVWRSFLRNRLDNAGNLLPSNERVVLKDCTDEESTRMYQVFSASKPCLNE